jgi:uncharacterized cysteine cluster protein YcgN (CxxCxxCC family)
MNAFWKTKTLDEMSRSEWESLCDGCGKCCLHKLKDEETNKVYYTKIACKLLDVKMVKCREYKKRTNLVPDCIKLNATNIKKISWLPESCAYRLVAEEKDLPNWHPLISKDINSVHTSGQSIKGYAVNEQSIDFSIIEDTMENYILDIKAI